MPALLPLLLLVSLFNPSQTASSISLIFVAKTTDGAPITITVQLLDTATGQSYNAITPFNYTGPPGVYRISVTPTVGIYSFVKWNDGLQNTTRLVNATSNQMYTLIYSAAQPQQTHPNVTVVVLLLMSGFLFVTFGILILRKQKDEAP